MKSNLFTSLFMVLMMLISHNAYSQPDKAHHDAQSDAANYYYVKTKDNTRFTGKLIYLNRMEREITFSIYDNFEVVVLQSNILSMRRINEQEVLKGDYLFPDVSEGLGLALPNGFGMRKGSLTYRTSNLLYHSLHYGLTDNITLHAGGELYTGIVLQSPAYHAGLTVNYPLTSKLKIGANISYANIINEYQNLVNGYGFVTFGDANTNITMGYGYGHPVVNTEVLQSTQFIPVSLKARLGRHLALISENWLFVNSSGQFFEPVFSVGMRMMWERVSIDVALVSNQTISQNFAAGIPLVNFSYRFGK